MDEGLLFLGCLVFLYIYVRVYGLSDRWSECVTHGMVKFIAQVMSLEQFNENHHGRQF